MTAMCLLEASSDGRDGCVGFLPRDTSKNPIVRFVHKERNRRKRDGVYQTTTPEIFPKE